MKVTYQAMFFPSINNLKSAFSYSCATVCNGLAYTEMDYRTSLIACLGYDIGHCIEYIAYKRIRVPDNPICIHYMMHTKQHFTSHAINDSEIISPS